MRAPSSVEETGGLALRRAVQRRDAIAAASGGLRTALGKRTVFWQARQIRHWPGMEYRRWSRWPGTGREAISP